MKVLVVDDNLDILNVMTILLESYGYEVNTTPRWQEIFELIDDFKPDLILLDYFLTGNDGGTICKQIKKTEGIKQIPVLLFSASINDFTKYGADGFISKPFDTKEMLFKINALIKKKHETA